MSFSFFLYVHKTAVIGFGVCYWEWDFVIGEGEGEAVDEEGEI